MRRLFEHRVERGVIIWHQSTSQSVFSLVTFVESVSASTLTFHSFDRSQLSIEVSFNDWNVFFIIQHVSPNYFLHLLDVMIRIFRVWKVHTHQFDVFTISQDRGSDDTLLMYPVTIILFLHLLFSMIPTQCLLSFFPAHMKMFIWCVWCVSHNLVGSCLHVSI